MGYELWTSRIAGYRRKGTRASDLRKLFDDGITARAIQEPLRACLYSDDALLVGEELRRLDFDIAGIKRDEDSRVEGFVRRADLVTGLCTQYANSISPLDLIAESTPLIKVLDVLRDKKHAFVLAGDEIAGIITRADLQKPPVRILLFGLISLFEMHLTFQINERYPDESWMGVLSERRLQTAKGLWEQRKGRNEEIDWYGSQS
jgi:CBS domain